MISFFNLIQLEINKTNDLKNWRHYFGMQPFNFHKIIEIHSVLIGCYLSSVKTTERYGIDKIKIMSNKHLTLT